jgi:hypothetical protein
MKAKLLIIVACLMGATCGAETLRLCQESPSSNEERFVVNGDVSDGIKLLTTLGAVEFKVEIADPHKNIYFLSMPKSLISSSMPCVYRAEKVGVAGGGVEGGG